MPRISHVKVTWVTVRTNTKVVLSYDRQVAGLRRAVEDPDP